MTPELTFFLSIIMAALASIPSFIALKGQRQRDRADNRKKDTESDGAIANAAILLLKPYREEVAENRLRQNSLEADVAELRGAIKSRDDKIEMRDRYISYLIEGIRKLVAHLTSMRADTIPFVPMPLSEFETLCATMQAPSDGD